MKIVDRATETDTVIEAGWEDRALLRSNPSAQPVLKHRTGHVHQHVSLPLHPDALAPKRKTCCLPFTTRPDAENAAEAHHSPFMTYVNILRRRKQRTGWRKRVPWLSNFALADPAAELKSEMFVNPLPPPGRGRWFMDRVLNSSLRLKSSPLAGIETRVQLSPPPAGETGLEADLPLVVLLFCWEICRRDAFLPPNIPVCNWCERPLFDAPRRS